VSRERTIAIINERAGAGAMADAFRRMEHQLVDAIGDFEVAFTDYAGHAIALVQSALEEGIARILVGGGDGTLNEAVNGWMAAAERPEGARLALLTGGTGGDFRRAVGLRDADAAVAAVAADRARPVDVGRLTCLDRPGGEPLTRHFLNIASFGLSGEADRHVPTFKQLGGRLAYVGATLRGLWGWRNPHVRLIIDDEPVMVGPMLTVAVANGQYFGGGMWIAPEAEVDDGLFHVTVLGDLGRLELLAKTARFYDKSHLRDPKVRSFTGRVVSAEADSPVFMDVDGEAIGVLPARFECLPGALSLVLP